MSEFDAANPSGQEILEGYSYRTSARFGSRVWLTITHESLTIEGPRIGKGTYRFWIGVQILFLIGIFAFIFTAIATLDWRWLLAAVLSLGLHGFVGGFGAGCLWELSNLIAFGNGTRGECVTFPIERVQRVRIGTGWARRSMWLLLLPYYLLINMSAKDCVSFEGPDGTAAQGVYAVHMHNQAEAARLAGLLQPE